MDFVIPSGGSANLPKELVDQIVEDATEKSLILRIMDRNDQMIEIVNEGTIPVIGEEDLDKVYRIDNTADITTLDEMTWDIKSPDLNPVELGTYIRLKRKQVEQYPELQLDRLFRNKISKAIARTADKIATNGDTSLGGGTDPLSVADGLQKLANSSNAANSPVTYSTSDAQNVLDAVADAQEQIGVYGADEELENLVIFGSSNFVTAAKKSASKDYVGYEIMDVESLGLRNVVHLHGIPVIRRLNLSGEKGLLTNTKGLFGGYYGRLTVDAEHEAARRADLLVITYWYDTVWAYLDSNSKSRGLIEISKASS